MGSNICVSYKLYYVKWIYLAIQNLLFLFIKNDEKNDDDSQDKRNNCCFHPSNTPFNFVYLDFLCGLEIITFQEKRELFALSFHYSK